MREALTYEGGEIERAGLLGVVLGWCGSEGFHRECSIVDFTGSTADKMTLGGRIYMEEL